MSLRERWLKLLAQQPGGRFEVSGEQIHEALAETLGVSSAVLKRSIHRMSLFGDLEVERVERGQLIQITDKGRAAANFNHTAPAPNYRVGMAAESDRATAEDSDVEAATKPKDEAELISSKAADEEWVEGAEELGDSCGVVLPMAEEEPMLVIPATCTTVELLVLAWMLDLPEELVAGGIEVAVETVAKGIRIRPSLASKTLRILQQKKLVIRVLTASSETAGFRLAHLQLSSPFKVMSLERRFLLGASFKG